MTALKQPYSLRACVLLGLITGLLVIPAHFLQAAETPAASIATNGDFQTDADGDDVPDGWAPPKAGVSYATEETNRYLHLASPKAGEMVLTYRQFHLPRGAKALELSWKQRTVDLKVGKNPWFDARILLQGKNAAGEKIAGSLPAPNTNKSSGEWVEKSVKFLVPEGARVLEFMPTLFQVQSGTFDIDDVVLRETDAAPLVAAAKAKADAAAEKLAATIKKRQTAAAARAEKDGEFIANGTFQTDGKGDAPDQWGALKGNSSWQKEDDNRFLRMVSPAPGKLVLHYHAVDLPAGVQAVEFKWSQRLSNFKRGKDNYFDARIMMQWLDAAGSKLPGSPSPSATAKNTEGWVEKSKTFLVPDGALTLVIMPTLFQVESGTLDLDNLSLKATDAAPLLAAAAERAAIEKAAHVEPETPNPKKWPAELFVKGNQIITGDGKAVWLQGVNVDSLEWNPRGEYVLRSTLVALEDWNANLLRLPIQEKFWFGQDVTQKDEGRAYRELVDQVVTLAGNRGAYVMLDLHRFRAPKQAHIDFWKEVAAKYKNDPAVLFELFNEPHGISWEVWRNGGFVADKNAPADEDAFLSPEEKALNTKGFHSVGVQALLDAVRSTGARNIVIAGGLDWSYDLTGIADGFALDEKGGNGLAYAAHIYAQKRDWLGKVMIVADKYPIIVSEVGANTKKFAFMPADSQEDAATWVPRMLGFIQANKLHWTAFSLHPGSAPVLITDWKYTPTPEWGALVKRALAGEKFPAPEKLR